MGLDKSVLEAEIAKITDPENPDFLGWPADVAEAAANWKAAYDTYAADAEDVSTDAVSSVNPGEFESTLANDMPAGEDEPSDSDPAGQAFDDSFVAYWDGGSFSAGTPPSPGAACPNVGGTGIFSVEESSAVNSIIGNTLKDLLTFIFDDVEEADDGAAKAADLAAAFDDSTTTAIIVLISGKDTTPPASGGPLPITNTCTVF